MDVAIVGGTGKQGSGLALRLAEAGHRVLIGSRDPARASAAATQIAELAGGDALVEASDNAGAASAARVVFVTVPYEVQEQVLSSISGALRADAVLVITSNPIARESIAAPGTIVSERPRSAAEEAQAMLPTGCRVVAGFQSVAAAHLRDLRRPVVGDVLLCGDNRDATALVGSLVEDIPDLRWVDVGDLSMARAVEHLTALLISVNHRYRVPGATVRIEGRSEWGTPPPPPEGQRRGPN